jgi:polysaccharide biosynthesis/export protein
MRVVLRERFPFRLMLCFCALLLTSGQVRFWESPVSAATPIGHAPSEQEIPRTLRSAGDNPAQFTPNLETSEDWNHRLEKLLDANPAASAASSQEYRIGSEDVLDINVFAAPELNRQVRVSASGEISLPLLGGIRAAGLTPRELERVLEELLHQKYMNDPHVSVFVRDIESHPVSVIGAVRKPGVFQIRGRKTLLEVLSLAEGVADDAGETVVIMRGAGLQNMPESLTEKSTAFTESPSTQHSGKSVEPALGLNLNKDDLPRESVVQLNLKELLESADLSRNPVVYPGDIVKVARAGIVYVVGAVERPGGFAMKTNEKISVLQAMALSGGLTRTAAKSGVRIIRSDEESGARTETPIDLGKIFAGKAPDPTLTSGDIVFVRDSAAKTVFSRGVEGAAQTATGLLIFHW